MSKIAIPLAIIAAAILFKMLPLILLAVAVYWLASD